MSSNDAQSSGSAPQGEPDSTEPRSGLPDASVSGLTAGDKDFVRFLTEEVEAVCNSKAFQRSPTLIKLLEFLTSETLAGHGDRLKSYTVAVDGLGRPADFDAHSDSYPRVQVARLRKMLAAYYEQHSPRHGFCVHIPPGSYGVHLDSRGVAYPNLPAGPLAASGCAGSIGAALGCWLDGKPAGIRSFWLAVIGGLALVLATYTTVLLYRHFVGGKMSARPAGAEVVYSPVLLVKPVAFEGDPRGRGIAHDSYGQLLNGLSKSWVVRIQTALDDKAFADNGHVYRLEVQLGRPKNGHHSLYLRLFDHSTATLVWAQEYSLRDDGADIGDVMRLVIAKIGGSFGVIADSETRRLGDQATPGYACELQYLRHVRTRLPELEERVRACLERPAPESRLEGVRLATRAMFTLDSSPATANREALVSEGRERAELAAEAYPDNDYTQLALARFAFAQRDCAGGALHARLAMAANSNDPYVVSKLVALTYFCGRPDPALADRAYRYLLDGDISSRMATILAAIASGQQERLEALANIPAPETAGNEAYNHLCNTLVFAALDKREEAVANWRKYQEALGEGSRSADDLLSEFIVSDLSRARVLEFLKAKHVVS